MIELLRGKLGKLLPPEWLEAMVSHRDFTRDDWNMVRWARPYTMTSSARILHLKEAIRYIEENRIPGAIVECGVWRGGSMMVAARSLLAIGCRDRDLYLYDTFDGMSAPTRKDISIGGQPAVELLATHEKRNDDLIWCVSRQEEVKANLLSTGYPAEKVHIIAGRVEETLPASAPPRIALLRLDTDWYESTLHELRTLYPRVSQHGIVVIDDYGHWKGARHAVAE